MANDPRDWMWSEALQMLARAERLHREVFTPPHVSQRGVNWEPPTDVLETEDAVLIFVALPGVDPEKVEVAIHNGVLLLAGERPLPAGVYGTPQSGVAHGCLVIRLPKAAAQRGRP